MHTGGRQPAMERDPDPGDAAAWERRTRAPPRPRIWSRWLRNVGRSGRAEAAKALRYLAGRLGGVFPFGRELSGQAECSFVYVSS